MVPNGAQMAPNGTQNCPMVTQWCPNGTQMVPNGDPMVPQWCQRPPAATPQLTPDPHGDNGAVVAEAAVGVEGLADDVTSQGRGQGTHSPRGALVAARGPRPREGGGGDGGGRAEEGEGGTDGDVVGTRGGDGDVIGADCGGRGYGVTIGGWGQWGTLGSLLTLY